MEKLNNGAATKKLEQYGNGTIEKNSCNQEQEQKKGNWEKWEESGRNCREFMKMLGKLERKSRPIFLRGSNEMD